MAEYHEMVADDLQLTNEELAERWVKPFNVITDLFRVKDIYGNLVPFTPYQYSVDFINAGFQNLNRDRVVLKSRQIGFSTIMELESLVTGMTFEDVEVSIISSQYKQSKKIIEACGNIIKNAAYPLPFHKSNIQKERIKSDSGVTIVPYSSNPDSIRGDNSIRVYCDEFAFVVDQDETLDAIEPKISRGGQLTMMSTPLRADDTFMQTYNDAAAGLIDTKAFFCPMYASVDETRPLTEQDLVPICTDIDINRVEKIRAKSIDRFLQEYMCTPVDEVNAYYPYEMILKCVDGSLMTQPQQLGNVTMGIDIALVDNETAIVINSEIDGVNKIVHFQTTRDEYDVQLSIIEQLYNQFRPEKIRSDATGTMGIQVERQLKDTYGYIVEGVTYTNKNKQNMAMRLKMLMQNTIAGRTPNIYLPEDKDLIAEIHNIKLDVSKGGNILFSGKHGGYMDDIANAVWLSLPPFTIEHMDEPVVSKKIGGTAPVPTSIDTGGFVVHSGVRYKRGRKRW
jgi:hypothetical protein